MKKLLYVFDNVNYQSGVQKTTATQIRYLREYYDISIVSLSAPQDESKKLFQFAHWLEIPPTSPISCFGTSLRDVISSNKFSLHHKFIRIASAICQQMGLKDTFIERTYREVLYERINAFDIVCVVSEASRLRTLVSTLQHPTKVQWIHTDYALWCQCSDWAKAVTKHDSQIYDKFDSIVCLSSKSKDGFVAIHKSLAHKTVVIRNMIAIDDILGKSRLTSSIQPDKNKFNIITVGRIDKEKAFDRILNICSILKNKQLIFHWYIVGGGVLEAELKQQIIAKGLEDTVTMTGNISNPYPLMLQCNLFALLSLYEGLPVTIDEAMVLGLPVIATDVGGIREQLGNGKYGVVVDNNEQSIVDKLEKIVLGDIGKATGYQSAPEYENKQIVLKLCELFI